MASCSVVERDLDEDVVTAYDPDGTLAEAMEALDPIVLTTESGF
ncbi:hypothetical protein AB0M43_35870 [Longispora sp. NPDC051575]